jgi:hypothetical protein
MVKCKSHGSKVRNFDFGVLFSKPYCKDVFSESWMNELVSFSSSEMFEYLWLLLMMGAIIVLMHACVLSGKRKVNGDEDGRRRLL